MPQSRKLILLIAIYLVGLFCMALMAGAAANLAHFRDVVRDERGNIISNASVYVYEGGTVGTLATIYTSRDGTTSKSNPTTSSSSGVVDFYAPSGTYSLVISRAGITTQTIVDLDVGQPVAQIGVQDLLYRPTTLVRPSSSGRETVNAITPLNALAWGVDNTGATDCSDSLQAFFDDVQALQPHDVNSVWPWTKMYLPTGIYRIDKPVYINRRMWVEGESVWGTQIRCNVPNGYAFMLQDTTDSRLYGVHIERMRFSQGDTTCGGMLISDASVCSYNDLEFNGRLRVGLEIRGATLQYFDNVKCNNCDTAIVMRYGKSFNLNEIHFDECSVFRHEVGIWLDGAGSAWTQGSFNNALIEQCRTILYISNKNGYSGMRNVVFENNEWLLGDHGFFTEGVDTICAIRIDGSRTNAGLQLTNVHFKNNVFFNAMGDFAIRIHENGYPVSSRTIMGVEFEDCEFAKMDSAVVKSAVSFPSFTFSGYTTARGDSTETKPWYPSYAPIEVKLELDEYEASSMSVVRFDSTASLPASPDDGMMMYGVLTDLQRQYSRGRWVYAPVVAVCDTAPPDTVGRRGKYFWYGAGDTMKVYTGTPGARWRPIW